MDLSPEAWTVIAATASAVAVLAAIGFGPPLWERVRAAQYLRETKRIGAADATIGAGEVPAPAKHRLSPFARLREHNARILREREERANHG